MSINSGIFLAFLALGVLAYYLCPKRVRWVVLLIWSAWFYLAYSVRAFAYLAVTVLLTYGASLWLGSLNRRQKQALASLPRAEQQGAKRAYIRRKRRILAIALVCNFATLALFKYLDSWFGNIHAVLGPRLERSQQAMEDSLAQDTLADLLEDLYQYKPKKP